MDNLVLLAILFLTVVVLILGIVFTYLAFRLFNLEFGLGVQKEDVFTDTEEPKAKVPLEKFIPDPTRPVTLSTKDNYTKQ